jgi:hypothetical protein
MIWQFPKAGIGALCKLFYEQNSHAFHHHFDIDLLFMVRGGGVR